MAKKVTPFLMFTGKAEEAMTFYVSLFKDGRIKESERFGAGEPGAEGSIKRGVFSVAGLDVMCFDSPPVHAFTFTPSFSLFVDCDDEAELDRLFTALSENGGVMMPPDNYGFSRKFAWVADRFGVSWQINLP